MPKVTDDYLEQRRQQVLDAATTCFAHKGFAATTIKDIAQEAGVSYGVVYHYFDSKEAIVAAGATQSDDERSRRFDELGQHEASVDVLAALLRWRLGRWTSPESGPEVNLRMQLMTESVVNESIRGIIGTGIADYRQRLAAIVRRGQKRGEIEAEVNPAAAACVLLAFNEGLVALKAIDPGIDAEAYLKTVITMVEGRFLTEAGKERRDDRRGDQTGRAAGRRSRRTG